MATLAALAVAVPAGWAVSRTPAVGWSLSLVVATYMLPPVALAVPLYMGLAHLGLLNNVFGYIGNLGNWSPILTSAAPGIIYTLMSLAAFGWLVLRR